MALEAGVELAAVGLQGAAVVHGNVVAVLGLARALDLVGCFDAQLGAEGEGEGCEGGEEGCKTHFAGGLEGRIEIGSGSRADGGIKLGQGRGLGAAWSAEVEVGFGGSAFGWVLLKYTLMDV